jgi:hypothetical protein
LVAFLSDKSIEGRTNFPKKHTSDPKILGAPVQNSVVMATRSPAFVHSWPSTCVTNRPLVANFKATVHDQIQASAISPLLPQTTLLLPYSKDTLLEFPQERRLSSRFFTVLLSTSQARDTNSKQTNATSCNILRHSPITGMRRITTFRATTDRIYDGGPIILYSSSSSYSATALSVWPWLPL